MNVPRRISTVFVLLITSILSNASWAGNEPPIADPNGPYSGIVGSPVTFDGTGSSDPEGSQLTFDWDFGDGSAGNGPTPTHTYATGDTFDVTLTVTDEAGAVDSAMTTATTIAGMYEIKFDPYIIGSHQRDSVIVVNHFNAAQPYSLRVMGTAYDPFTGEQLDSQTVDVIPPGQGVRIPFTLTHPEPHASWLVLQVEVFHDGREVIRGGDRVGVPPFSLTRVLTTRKDETVLQVKGIPIILNGATH